jgi:hypothetical protein
MQARFLSTGASVLLFAFVALSTLKLKKEKEAAEAAQRRRAASEAKARRYSRPSPQGSRSRTSRAHPGGSVVRLFGPGIWQGHEKRLSEIEQIKRLSNMNLITPGEVRSLLEDLPPLFPQPGRKFPSPDTGHRSIA